MLKRTLKSTVLCTVLILLLTGCGTKQEAHFYSWMYDINLSSSDVTDILGDPDSNGMWSNYELIDDIPGTFEIHSSSYPRILNYWEWTLYADDKTYQTIKSVLSRTFSDSFQMTLNEDNQEYVDEMYVYKAEQFKEGNYSGDWTLNDEKLSSFSESELNDLLEDDFHAMLLLKKDDKVCIQYVPINRYGVLATISWYHMD